MPKFTCVPKFFSVYVSSISWINS